MNPQAQSVLDFWYDSRKPRNEQAKIWFAGKELDNTIREKFIDLVCGLELAPKLFYP